MKSIYSTKMQDKTNNDISKVSPGNFLKKEGLRKKLSLMQFAFTPNYNKFNGEKRNEFNAEISPLGKKRLNSMKLNFPPNELRETAGFNLNNEQISNQYPNNNYFPKEPEKDLNIKSKVKNQSELNISLKFLRGKSFRKSEIKFNFKDSPGKGKTTKNNFSNTIVVSQNTDNAFSKFFKKPLTFRVSEFEEKNQIEKDQKNIENKTYAQQRFFGHTMNENSNTNGNFAAKNKIISLNSNSSNASKKNYLDDIEKVTLVNNEEELVKKYVLPEIKYLTTNERNKLFHYDVHDNTDKFVIKKSNGVFLSDLLKSGINSPAVNSPLKSKSIEKNCDMRNTKANVNETKFGDFPKFLMKTSGFVKFGEDAAARKLNFDLDNKYGSPKKIEFHQTINENGYLNNFVLNNDDHNNVTEDSQLILNNLKKGNFRIDEINKYNENDYFYNEEKNKLVNKTDSPSLNFKLNDFQSTHKPYNPSKLPKFNNTINVGNINKEILSPFYSNFSNGKKNAFHTSYISSNGYEINRDKYSITNNRKHDRIIFLDYPQIKFPIQPYKKMIGKKKDNPNYLTNGSIIKDPETMKNIQLANERTAMNFKNERENVITLQMTENIDKLSKIEKKIADLIEVSRVNMKDKQEYKKFTSNTSIVMIK